MRRDICTNRREMPGASQARSEDVCYETEKQENECIAAFYPGVKERLNTGHYVLGGLVSHIWLRWRSGLQDGGAGIHTWGGVSSVTEKLRRLNIDNLAGGAYFVRSSTFSMS